MSEETNVVTLSGLVDSLPVFDHCLYGEDFFSFNINIPRLSGATDILPLTVSGRLMDVSPKIGDHITVRGQLRSYNKQIDGYSRLIITVFAKTYELETECREFINDISITGFICKPVIYRQTPFQREIADMLVAVNRQYGKSDYLPCIAWGRNARFASKLDIGEQIRLEGRVQSRKYQKVFNADDEPIERVAYEISCSMLESIQDEAINEQGDYNTDDNRNINDASDMSGINNMGYAGQTHTANNYRTIGDDRNMNGSAYRSRPMTGSSKPGNMDYNRRPYYNSQSTLHSSSADDYDDDGYGTAINGKSYFSEQSAYTPSANKYNENKNSDEIEESINDKAVEKVEF